MSGEKDFLDEFAEQDGIEPIAEQPKQTEVEPAGRGPQRGPDGKFIKAEAEARAEQAEKGAKEAAAMQQVTEPPSEDDESQTVPLSALKALRKELQELKRSQGTSAQTQQPKAPEFTGPQVAFEDDPKAHMISLKMQMSKFMATQQNDEQTVNEAWAAFDDACRVDEGVSLMSHRLVNHPHPMAEIVKWYNNQRELNAIREAGGLEALKQRWLAEQGVTPQPAQSPTRPNVPMSLAGTGKARTSDEPAVPDGFDALFKR